jgi:Pyruvate/2-oxoacid:ferredoxin oxidoreductase delta subunit
MIREIKIDQGRCIGCSACSRVCPAGLITLRDSLDREIWLSPCSEDCQRCLEACPEDAITLVESGGDSLISFELMACKVCSQRFAPRKMIDRIKRVLPETDPASWADICPGCRRDIERRGAARQEILRRN